VPDTEGGRALDGWLFFDNASPWCYLTIEWGRRVLDDDRSTSRLFVMELPTSGRRLCPGRIKKARNSDASIALRRLTERILGLIRAGAFLLQLP